MSDRCAVALAVLVAVGAAAARGPSPAVGAAVVALALVARRPWLLCLGAALLASGLAQRAWLDRPVIRPGTLDTTVTLLGDPGEVHGALRLEVRSGSHRLEAWARGSNAALLAPRLAGERVHLTGRLAPIRAGDAWLVRRHIVGRVDVSAVGDWAAGNVPSRAANGVRRLLADGAVALDPPARSLFMGLVLGDTRAQSAVQTDDFRGAGLSHLLAVSGENVAFALALARPVLSRVGLYVRLPATLAALAFFALLTRFEPSVLRACAMAGLAALTATLGRESSRLRLLAFAVAGLLLADPMLVGVTGFQLSVAATAGIVLLAPRIAAAIPGPRSVAGALGVTIAAQIGVAPIQIPAFGGLPVVSVLANLLAVPAAGMVMTWGLSAGVMAGVLGGRAAWLLHRPTALLLAWIAAVARVATRVPLGQLGAPHAVALAAIACGGWAWTRRDASDGGGGGFRAFLVGAAAVVIALPAVALDRSPPLADALVPGVMVWRGASARSVAVVTIDSDAADAESVLEGLRLRGVGRISVVVVCAPTTAGGTVLDALTERYRPPLVLAPPGWFVPGAQAATSGLTLRTGGLVVTVSDVRPMLVVAVRRDTPSAAARGPPTPRPSPNPPGVGRRGPV
jgi:competence protein ComEC